MSKSTTTDEEAIRVLLEKIGEFISIMPSSTTSTEDLDWSQITQRRAVAEKSLELLNSLVLDENELTFGCSGEQPAISVNLETDADVEGSVDKNCYGDQAMVSVYRGCNGGRPQIPSPEPSTELSGCNGGRPQIPIS